MRLTILGFGTRGDVQPILALGRGLQERGHRVRVCASAHFQPWIESQGLEAAPATVDIAQVMASEGGRDWVEHGHDQLRQVRLMKRLVARHGRAMMEDGWTACQGADAVVSSFTTDIWAASIAEKLGVPQISTPLQPVLLATRSGAATPSAPRSGGSSWLNWLFGKLLVEPFGWRLAGALQNRFRREVLGLPAQSRRQNAARLARALVVHGYSAQVVPHAPDWPSRVHTAGYWFLDADRAWQPPVTLSRFLDGGEPPVFIGFGSMTGHDPERLTRMLVEAVQQSGRRAVLQSGWANLGGGTGLPPSVALLDAAPHEWLFPRMAAVVHHGGAGTTGQGLRAGVPTVVVPAMADQPFWGARVAALGVGPPPIPRHRLEPGRLAAAIRVATGDLAMRQRSAELGSRLRGEDGVAAAVTLIESHLSVSANASTAPTHDTSHRTAPEQQEG